MDRRAPVVAAALLALVTPAAAEPAPTSDQTEDLAGPLPDYHLRWELGMSGDFGGAQVGPKVAYEGGARVEAALRFDRVALVGSYALLKLDDGACTGTRAQCRAVVPVGPGNGLEQRVGLDVRYSVYRAALEARGQRDVAAPGQLVRADVYVEAGVGREWIDWGSLQLDRQDASFGVGVALSERRGGGAGAVQLGLRAVLARDPTLGMSGIEPAVLLTFGGRLGN